MSIFSRKKSAPPDKILATPMDRIRLGGGLRCPHALACFVLQGGPKKRTIFKSV